MSELLGCASLVAGRDRRAVVHDVNLSVGPGDVVALLGPNGAGKTTTMLTLAGLFPRLGGSITFAGKPVTHRRPHRLARQGLVLVPDDRALFRGLSVRQTLGLARRKHGPSIDDIVGRFPVLGTRMNVAAGDLSGGQQQILAIGRALIQRPSVLLIDELSLGLAPSVVKELLPAITSAAKEDGMGLIVVEQHVALILDVADYAVVLSHGKVVLSEDAESLRSDVGRIEEAYFAGTAGPRPS